MLQKQYIDIPFGRGVQERVQKEILDPQAGAVTLVNVVEAKRGAWSKRPGFSALTTSILGGGAVAAGRRAGSRGISGASGTWMTDGHLLYDYSPTAAAWVQKDRMPECVARRSPLPGAPPGALSGGHNAVYVNGYHIVSQAVSTSGSGAEIFVTVIDAATGAVMSTTDVTDVNAGYGGASGGPLYEHRLVQSGTNVWVIYCDINGAGAGSLCGVKLDTTNVSGGWSARVALIGASGTRAASVTGRFSATGSAANGFCVAWFDATVLSVSRFNDAGALQTAAAVTGVGFAYPVDLHGMDTSTLWVAYVDSATSKNMSAIGISPTALTTTYTAAVVATTVGDTFTSLGVVATSNTTACAVASAGGYVGTTNNKSYVAHITGGTPITVTTSDAATNLVMCSAPFLIGTRVYMAAMQSNGLTGNVPYCQIIDISSKATPQLNFRPVANLAPGNMGLLAGNPLQTASTGAAGRTLSIKSGTKAYFTLPIGRNASSNSLDLVELNFEDTNRWQPVDMGGGSLSFSGGCATVYDGQAVMEHGFVTPPVITSVTNAGTGITGTFSYVAIYEYIDADGNVHWSEPSAPFSSGAVSNKTMTITVTNPTIGSRMLVKGQVVQVALYRTESLGNTYYRVSSTATKVTNSVTFADATSTYAANPQLYTQPGTPGTALPRRAPPSLTCMIQHNDGLCGVADDGQTIWCSGQRVAGEGWWWNPLMVAIVEDSNTVVALASFEGRLYAFTRRNIWVIDGQGFSDNGMGGYSPPQLLPTDVGCIEPRSLVVTTDGCYFQSDRGLMLLNRSSAVSWVGEPIASTLTTYPVISSTVVDPVRHLVLFALATSESGGAGVTGPGRVAVYDYAGGQWSVWDFTGAAGAHVAIQSMWMQGTTLYMMDALGFVYSETPGTSLDLGGWVTMQVELPAFKIAGLQGFQRIWRGMLSFISNTPHDLLIEFAFDDGGYTESAPFTAAQIATLSPAAVWHHFARQKCTKVQVRFTDVTPSSGAIGAGLGPTLLGWRFQCGVKGKTPRTQGAHS